MTLALSRRGFVEQLLLTTAGLAGLGCSCSKIERKKLPPPGERINVAIIGAGYYGKKHVGLWTAQKNAIVSHVCDPDEARGREIVELADKYQELAPAYKKDMRHIFESKDVDIVAIATPHHWHAVAAIWAMQAGKDVYLEKPVSHNVAEGRLLVQAARKYGRMCQAGTHRRSDPNLAAAAAYVRAGKLGAPRLSRCITYKRREQIGAPGKYSVPESCDYELWAGPAGKSAVTRERFHYDWHWLWDYGNGALGNNGVHRIDLSRWLFDLKGLGDGVISYGGRFGERDAGQTPNTQITMQTFGKVCVIQEIRGLPTEPYGEDCVNGVYFEGSEGSIVNANGKTALFDPQGKMIKEFFVGEVIKADHFGNFIEAAKSRKVEDLNCDIEEGHLSSAVCHVANISQRLGKKASPAAIQKALSGLDVVDDVKDTLARTTGHLKDNDVREPLSLGPWLPIDSQKENFGEHADANALLVRKAYRKGFELPKLA